MKNILILGAGRVSRPIVRYLLGRTDAQVVVASRTESHARQLVGDHPRGRACTVDVEDTASLEALIREAAVVISLVPYAYHLGIAKLAIRHGVHVVTTSYVSPEMRELDEAASRAGVLILNEVGLDPGIDHMSAMRIIDRVRRTGGIITHFSSCCGGLPAPESNTNPWGYKFSWSPRGVILAGRNAARYLRDGELVDITGPELFDHRWPYEVEGVGLLEIYPNRDSLPYVDLYGIHDIRNMFRGTIRYPGWCRTLKAVADLGLLDLEERDWPAGTTYREFLGGFLPDGRTPLEQRLAQRLGVDLDDEIVTRLEWAGFLSERPLAAGRASPLDIVASRFQQTMTYRPGERDMIVLRHEFVATWPDRPAELIVSLLAAYGETGGNSAMSRTVSLPAAVAARLLTERVLQLSGVRIPVYPEIYNPIMDELESMGIRFRDRAHLLLPGPFSRRETTPRPEAPDDANSAASPAERGIMTRVVEESRD